MGGLCTASSRGLYLLTHLTFIQLPRWLSGKESTCQCRRHGFNPSVGKIPWMRKRQPTPVFLPGKLHGHRSPTSYIVHGVSKSWTWLSMPGSFWWIGRPGVLRFMGSQRVRHDWATELNWTEHACTQAFILITALPLWYYYVMLPILGTKKLIDRKVKAIAKIAHLDTGGAGI